MNDLEFSMSEIVIMAMALRVLCEQPIAQRDKEIAQLLDRKLRISYKGRKVRVILSDEQ